MSKYLLKERNYILFFVLIIFLVLVIDMVSGRIVTLEFIQRYATTIKNYVDDNYGASLIVYLLLSVSASFLGIPVTILLTVLAGYLFGTILGSLYSVIGSTVGTTLLVVFTRFIDKGRVAKKYERYLSLLNSELARYGHYYLLLLQLLPMTPTFLLTMVVGVTNVTIFTYIWTTALGIFPGTLIYASFGRQLYVFQSLDEVLTSWPVIALFILSVLSTALFIYKRMLLYYGGQK